MANRRVVIDPITRIEGHLRIEVEVDEDNVVHQAVRGDYTPSMKNQGGFS